MEKKKLFQVWEFSFCIDKVIFKLTKEISSDLFQI